MQKDENLGNCWFCERDSVEQFFEPVDSAPFFDKSPALICKSCGFIYKRPSLNEEKLHKRLKKSYYGSYSFDELLKRSRSRAFVDTSRSVEYIQMIGKYVDLKNVRTAVDIGGAEGLFSHTLKKMYPIDVYCLEPDVGAIRVGRELYPEVKFLDLALEQIDRRELPKFDLLTYFGGFYRTNEPLVTMLKIQSVMADNGFLVFSLPFTLDSPNNQADEPYVSIDDILGNASFLMLDSDYMQSFIERYFNLVGKENRQHYPFVKEIPFFIARQSETVDASNRHLSITKYVENRNFIQHYADRLSEQNLQSLVARNAVRNIAIFGVGKEAQILARIAPKADVQVLYHIDPFCCDQNSRELDNVPVCSLTKVHQQTPDMIIIADHANQQDIYEQLVTRVHLDRITKVVKGFSSREYTNNNAVFCYKEKYHLQKAFVFPDA